MVRLFVPWLVGWLVGACWCWMELKMSSTRSVWISDFLLLRCDQTGVVFQNPRKKFVSVFCSVFFLAIALLVFFTSAIARKTTSFQTAWLAIVYLRKILNNYGEGVVRSQTMAKHMGLTGSAPKKYASDSGIIPLLRRIYDPYAP
jgi:hypothetical protein